ncbi:putative transcriptional regulatory protein [Cyphellophora attinorum]|uniref:Putative transcriptional regulatory protein n=1 Tax=Cyphellophora attinorum TaxID=1664694 RepID=A0A0N1HHX5_9EURO|nr:putative transcriptional regulatory protein [Phialophora attinorum]KPI45762.1 putative transcriptional regulatory protein [Phialophora attinorum]
METVGASVPAEAQRDQIVVSRPSPDSVVDDDSDRESRGSVASSRSSPPTPSPPIALQEKVVLNEHVNSTTAHKRKRSDSDHLEHNSPQRPLAWTQREQGPGHVAIPASSTSMTRGPGPGHIVTPASTTSIQTDTSIWTRVGPGNSPPTPDTPGAVHADEDWDVEDDAAESTYRHEPNGTGKRKRNFSRRTKDGCKTCRRRKKKCDEAKPFCENCAKSGNTCEGYAPKGYNGRSLAQKIPVPLVSKSAPPTDVADTGLPNMVGRTWNGAGSSARGAVTQQNYQPRSMPHATDGVSNGQHDHGPAAGLDQQPLWPQHGPRPSSSTNGYTNGYTNGHLPPPHRLQRGEHTAISSPAQDMRPASSRPPSTTLPPLAAMAQQGQPPPPPTTAASHHSANPNISPPPPPAGHVHQPAPHSRQPSYAPSHMSSGGASEYRHTPPASAPVSRHGRHASTYHPAPPSGMSSLNSPAHTSHPPIPEPSPINAAFNASAGTSSGSGSLPPILPPPPTSQFLPTAQYEIAKSRMLRGAPYNALDNYLMAERQRCEAACERFNNKLKEKPLNAQARAAHASVTGSSAFGSESGRSPSRFTNANDALIAIVDPTADPSSGPHVIPQKGILTYGVVVDTGFQCSYGYNLRLMESCYIRRDVFIDDSAVVEIGARCVIGTGTRIETSSPCLERVARDGANTEMVAKPVIIETEVIVGGGCFIIGGVRIGKGATIKPFCNVDRDVPDGVVFEWRKKLGRCGWAEEEEEEESEQTLEDRLVGFSKHDKDEAINWVVEILEQKEKRRREQRKEERREERERREMERDARGGGSLTQAQSYPHLPPPRQSENEMRAWEVERERSRATEAAQQAPARDPRDERWGEQHRELTHEHRRHEHGGDDEHEYYRA